MAAGPNGYQLIRAALANGLRQEPPLPPNRVGGGVAPPPSTPPDVLTYPAVPNLIVATQTDYSFAFNSA
jgi:hypothetical protein